MSERTSPSGRLTGLNASVTIDAGEIAANTLAIVNAALASATVGDIPVVAPEADIQPGILVAWARIATAGNIRIALQNVTTGPINPDPITFRVNLRRR